MQDQGDGDAPRRAATEGESLLSSDPRAVQNPEELAQAAGFERYVVGERISSPTSHDVLRCVDSRILRKVAMKVRAVDAPDVTRRRFLREARIQAQLEHPAVVPVYDIGATPDGREYFTMQLVSGKALRAVLDGIVGGDEAFVRRFARDRLLELFQQLCLAVHYIHERGVVHRNLTPDNVLLGDFGEVYVTDWSIARVVSSASAVASLRGAPAFTAPGTSMGTPGYAAPEQLAGLPLVDRGADVYSLGAILFEILALEPLHPGKTSSERARSTHVGVDARVSVRAPHLELPLELDGICVTATAPTAEERYGTARELSDAVERFVETERDVSNRLRLADRHADNAEAAAVRALVGTTGSVEQRRLALREAGRALALNPSSAGARRAVAALLREPSTVLPDEARRALEAEQVEESRFLGRFGFGAYFVFGVVLGLVALSGILSWLGFMLVLVPIALTLGLCHSLMRSNKPEPRLVLAIYFSSLVAIAGVSGFYGPLLLVPQLAVASTQALNLGLLRGYRAVMLACALLAITVPFALQGAGILPSSYEFAHGSFEILPIVRRFPEAPVRVSLLFTSLAALVVPSLYLWRVRDSLVEVRTRLEVHGWQLAQLLPAGSHTAAPHDSSTGQGP